jgi:hypothetical protein
MTGRVRQLVSEMRRRRVARVLGAYTAAALAVIYAADANCPAQGAGGQRASFSCR